MKGYIVQIEDATRDNQHYRRVLFTAKHSQLVLDGEKHAVSDGFAVVIPAGTRHNVVNSGKTAALKLYSLYSPPEHKDGIIHKTKQEADADHDHHFDGRTSMK